MEFCPNEELKQYEACVRKLSVLRLHILESQIVLEAEIFDCYRYPELKGYKDLRRPEA